MTRDGFDLHSLQDGLYSLAYTGGHSGYYVLLTKEDLERLAHFLDSALEDIDRRQQEDTKNGTS